jgi:hypothetical protein
MGLFCLESIVELNTKNLNNSPSFLSVFLVSTVFIQLTHMIIGIGCINIADTNKFAL